MENVVIGSSQHYLNCSASLARKISQQFACQLDALSRSTGGHTSSDTLLPLHCCSSGPTAASKPGHVAATTVLSPSSQGHHQHEELAQQEQRGGPQQHSPAHLLSTIRHFFVGRLSVLSLSNVAHDTKGPLLPLYASTSDSPSPSSDPMAGVTAIASSVSFHPSSWGSSNAPGQQHQHHQNHQHHQHQHHQHRHHYQQQQRQRQRRRQKCLNPPFPLGRTPEDVRPNVLSFLPARDLSRARRVSRDFFRTVDRDCGPLWSALCRREFPSMASPLTSGEAQQTTSLSPHQQYIRNAMERANDDAGNLRASHRLRESLESFSRLSDGHSNKGNASVMCITTSATTAIACMSIRRTFGSKGSVPGRDGSILGGDGSGSSGVDSGGGVDSGDGNAGIIGLLSDLVTVPDPRIARALSHKYRAALSTVVVHSEKVISEFRRSCIHTGPVNFLPVSTLRLQNRHLLPPPPTGNTAAAGSGAGWMALNGSDDGGGQGVDMLPLAQLTTASTGFLGYAVRLLHLRPEHEPLRWTVLFAFFKDLVVFETIEQAEAVRARTPNQRLFYCALDCTGAQDDLSPLGGYVLPHISHWGFQPGLHCESGESGERGRGKTDGMAGRKAATVEGAINAQERSVDAAKSSLAAIERRRGAGEQQACSDALW